MKKPFLSVVVLITLASVSFAQRYAVSPAQQLFEQAKTFLETEYFGPAELDLPALFARYQGLVDATCAEQKDGCAYATVEGLIAQMLAEFNDPHTFYYSAATVSAVGQLTQGSLVSQALQLGFQAIRFCDTPTGACTQTPQGQIQERQLPERFVSGINRSGPAFRSGLRYGDRILGHDDVLYATASSNAELTRMNADFAQRVQSGQTLRLQVQRGAKRERLELRMTGEKLQQAETPSLELRDDQIAVLHIKTFLIQGTGAIIHQLIKTALDQNVRGIVINLRGTSGGSALESLATIGAFIEQPQALRIVPRYDADANRIELGYAAAQAFVRVNGTAAENLNIRNPVLFKGPLAVLVDGGCASACEFLPIYIQKNNRGKVYGTPTVGVGNTNTQLFPLLNGGAVNFPTVQIHWADGSGRLPARSQPDTLTPNFLFEHFSSGLDVPLEKAITELNGK